MNRPPSFKEFMTTLGASPAPTLKRQEGPPLLYPETQGDPPPQNYPHNGLLPPPRAEDKYSGGTAIWNDVGRQSYCPADRYYEPMLERCIPNCGASGAYHEPSDKCVTLPWYA